MKTALGSRGGDAIVCMRIGCCAVIITLIISNKKPTAATNSWVFGVFVSNPKVKIMRARGVAHSYSQNTTRPSENQIICHAICSFDDSTSIRIIFRFWFIQHHIQFRLECALGIWLLTFLFNTHTERARENRAQATNSFLTNNTIFLAYMRTHTYTHYSYIICLFLALSFPV